MHALGLPRPKRPAVGHGLGTVKGTLAPARCERGLEGSQERGHPPGPRGPQQREEGAVVAEDAVVALRDVDEGRADDFEDALFGNAGAGLGDFAFVIQGAAVAKQQRKLQEAEVQEQCCVQEAPGSSGDGGWGDIGEQPARKARRKRSDGPPQVNRSTGSLCKALDIAADPVALEVARDLFDDLVYAPTTAASKVTRAQLWGMLADKMGVDALPLTPDKVMSFGAVLREARYRSGGAYISEAKQQHIRAGYASTGDLEQAIVDAKRGISRGIGPPSKAAEVKPGLWDELWRAGGAQQGAARRPPGGPRGGIYVWGFGSAWLLREIELALLDVHADTIQFNADSSEVTLRLGATKADIKGRGAARTHRCRCDRQGAPSCPVCSARHLVDAAVHAWGGNRADEAAKAVPLIGTMASAGRRTQNSSESRACTRARRQTPRATS